VSSCRHRQYLTRRKMLSWWVMNKRRLLRMQRLKLQMLRSLQPLSTRCHQLDLPR
jgi:hypothetical protein